MPKLRLTDKGFQKLIPIDGKRTEYWDLLLPSFGVRVSKTGKQTFVMMYRFDRRLRRLSLGQYPKVSLSDARTRARENFEKIENGIDPAVKQAAEKAGKARTFKELSDLYMELYAKPKKKSWKNDEQFLRNDFNPKWGNRSAHNITREDVVERIEAVAARAPTSGNRALATIRKLFRWSVKKRFLDSSPVIEVEAPTDEVSRDRVLTNVELKKVWQATEKMGYPWRPFYQLLILTLQRREEVAGMLHEELDLVENEWNVGGTRTKNGIGNITPLPAIAVSLIEELKCYGSDFVFPARGQETKTIEDGGRHISGFSAAKIELDQLSGVKNWRVHDLRRTGATKVARLKAPPHVVEKILNHTTGEISGVALIYNRYGYIDEKREALDTWSDYIQNVILADDQKVVPMERNVKAM